MLVAGVIVKIYRLRLFSNLRQLIEDEVRKIQDLENKESASVRDVKKAKGLNKAWGMTAGPNRGAKAVTAGGRNGIA